MYHAPPNPGYLPGQQQQQSSQPLYPSAPFDDLAASMGHMSLMHSHQYQHHRVPSEHDFLPHQSSPGGSTSSSPYDDQAHRHPSSSSLPRLAYAPDQHFPAAPPPYDLPHPSMSYGAYPHALPGHRGRGRDHPGRSGGTDHRRGQGYRKLWQAVTKVGKGQRLGDSDAMPFSDMTVEDMLRIIRSLPPGTSAVKAISQGLYYLDSRALAALLKDLAKSGSSHIAFEIFDWLRSLDETHELAALCDVYTYTTMISQCGSHHQLRVALELVAEMRGREIPCNVHTYSALMNVCIKANEVELALDVYQQMLNEGCIPNLVTYNILVDVYAKAGRWQDAVDVLQQLHSQGLDAEPRTYNTIMQACNAAGEYERTNKIFHRMLAAGAVPTGASYAAAIAALCKLRQMDAALKLFADMTRNGCEHALTTFNTLLAACADGADWQLAVELLQQMRLEGIRPNTLSYSSAISACLQGGQYLRAQEMMTAMQTGCKLEPSSHAQYLLLHQWCGRWPDALRAFETMRGNGMRQDASTFSAMIEVLWAAGSAPAREVAAALFQEATLAGVLRHTVGGADAEGGAVELRVAPLLPGPALLALAALCVDVRERVEREGAGWLKETVVLTVGTGAPSQELREALLCTFAATASPFRPQEPRSASSSSNGGSTGGAPPLQFTAASAAVAAWLQDDAGCGWLLALCPSRLVAAGTSPRGAVPDRAMLVEQEHACELQCHNSMASVRQVEHRCRIDIKKMLGGYALQRKKMVALAQLWCGALGASQETLHDVLLLLDRAACSGFAAPPGTEPPLEMLLAGCVAICVQRGEPQGAAMIEAAAPEAMGGWAGDNLAQAVAMVGMVLMRNTSAISALRVLQLYLQRLAATTAATPSPQQDGDLQERVGAHALAIVGAAVGDHQFMSVSPSLLAAASLLVARRNAGLWPHWPACLASLTHYYNLEASCHPILSALSVLPAASHAT